MCDESVWVRDVFQLNLLLSCTTVPCRRNDAFGLAGLSGVNSTLVALARVLWEPDAVDDVWRSSCDAMKLLAKLTATPLGRPWGGDDFHTFAISSVSRSVTAAAVTSTCSRVSVDDSRDGAEGCVDGDDRLDKWKTRTDPAW